MKERQPFRIEIENIKDIYQIFKEPTSYNEGCYHLGQTVLYNPFEKISVNAISDGNSYSSLVQLRTILDKEKISHAKVSLPINTLKQKFNVKSIRDSAYILDQNGKPEYELSADCVLDSGVSIYIGKGSGISEGNTPRKQVGTVDSFVSDMERYKDLIETTVNGVYVEKGKDVEEMVMYWRPPMKRDKSLIKDFFNGSDFLSKLGDEYINLKGKIEVSIPGVSFEDIGGQDQAKKEIQGLSFALKNPKLYAKWGTRPPRGILLHGPPGTGKTLMAKALATEADAKFYHVKVSDITSKWYGESEKLIQSVFDLAKENGKTIIFFDELDAIAPHRDYSHEASSRIVSTMLVNLDGIGSNENSMIVGSTNRIDSIDPALTRPGRIDRLVEVPLPDEKGRKQIFHIHRTQAESIAGRKLFSEGAYDCLTKQEQFSGADIAEIVRRTLEEKVRQEGALGKELELVTEKDVEQQIKLYERTKEVKKKIGFA